jgi:hypothetical protein
MKYHSNQSAKICEEAFKYINLWKSLPLEQLITEVDKNLNDAELYDLFCFLQYLEEERKITLKPYQRKLTIELI